MVSVHFRCLSLKVSVLSTYHVILQLGEVAETVTFLAIAPVNKPLLLLVSVTAWNQLEL